MGALMSRFGVIVMLKGKKIPKNTKKCKINTNNRKLFSFFLHFFIANTINISAKRTLHPPTVRVRENVSLVLVGGEILFIMGKLCLKIRNTKIFDNKS
jgi:hypothetical protein